MTQLFAGIIIVECGYEIHANACVVLAFCVELLILKRMQIEVKYTHWLMVQTKAKPISLQKPEDNAINLLVCAVRCSNAT